MADQETVALTLVSKPLGGGELVHIVQGGNSRYGTIADVRGLVGGLRNFYINGGHEVYQRGNVSIPAGSFAYTLDRFLVTNDTNQTVVVTQENQSPGSILIPGNPRYKMRLNFASAPTTGVVRIAQRIEDVYSLQWMNASARAYFTGPTGSEALASEIVQNFGTTGSPSSEVVTAAATLDVATIYDASTQERKAQYSVPSISGKILGTDKNDYLEIAWVLTPRQSGDYEVSRMSFVEGDASAETDPFCVHSNEEHLCHRYCWVPSAPNSFYLLFYSPTGAQYFSNHISSGVGFRASPTLSYVPTIASNILGESIAYSGGGNIRLRIRASSAGTCYNTFTQIKAEAEL